MHLDRHTTQLRIPPPSSAADLHRHLGPAARRPDAPPHAHHRRRQSCMGPRRLRGRRGRRWWRRRRRCAAAAGPAAAAAGPTAAAARMVLVVPPPDASEPAVVQVVRRRERCKLVRLADPDLDFGLGERRPPFLPHVYQGCLNACAGGGMKEKSKTTRGGNKGRAR